MEIDFTKIVGAGNDFIVIDNRDRILDGMESNVAREICRRRFSVGADGLLLIENTAQADFLMRIFNPDGTEAEMCGNGARCAALYASLNNIASPVMNFETIAGLIRAEVKDDKVKVNLGKVENLKRDLNLHIDEGKKKGYYLKIGVPHTVIIEDSLHDIPVTDWGRQIRLDPQFLPEGTNVDFIAVKNEDTIMMRTYERGVEGETLACGTGAVASAVIAHLVAKMPETIHVMTKSEDFLTVYLKKKEDTFEVALEGGAGIVYQGKIII